MVGDFSSIHWKIPFYGLDLSSLKCTNKLCVLLEQLAYSFRPLDYESLQQELALKETVWKKVSPESNEDVSTTVVYRMESLGEKS